MEDEPEKEVLGATLEETWRNMSGEIKYAAGLDDNQLDMCEAAFYAGAACVTKLLSPTVMSLGQSALAVGIRRKELLDEMQERAKRVAQKAGRHGT